MGRRSSCLAAAASEAVSRAMGTLAMACHLWAACQRTATRLLAACTRTSATSCRPTPANGYRSQASCVVFLGGRPPAVPDICPTSSLQRFSPPHIPFLHCNTIVQIGPSDQQIHPTRLSICHQCLSQGELLFNLASEACMCQGPRPLDLMTPCQSLCNQRLSFTK